MKSELNDRERSALDKSIKELDETITITTGELVYLIGLARVAANRIYSGDSKVKINNELEEFSDKYLRQS
jgi:hypothetical protein